MLYRFAYVRLREGTRTHFDRYTDFKWPLTMATPKERPVKELPSLNKAVKGGRQKGHSHELERGILCCTSSAR